MPFGCTGLALLNNTALTTAPIVARALAPPSASLLVHADSAISRGVPLRQPCPLSLPLPRFPPFIRGPLWVQEPRRSVVAT